MVIFYCGLCMKITKCAVYFLWLYIPESLQSFPTFDQDQVLYLYSHHTVLNLVSSAGLKWRRCLHLQSFGIPANTLKRGTRPHQLVSGGSKGSFNVREYNMQRRIS